MPANEIYNFKEFTADIDTSGLVSEAQLCSLSGEGYVAVVNLLPDDSEYAIENERSIIESQGIEYHYRPVDFAAPSESDFKWFEATVQNLPRGTSLIHCAANYRVSAFSAIYAYRNLGWSAQEAYSFIADIWDLAEHSVWGNFVGQWVPKGNS